MKLKGLKRGEIMDYSMNELRLFYAQDSIMSWSVERNGDEWLVSFVLRGNVSARSYLLDTRRKQIKKFKSLDSAINNLQEIGFDVKKLKSCE